MLTKLLEKSFFYLSHPFLNLLGKVPIPHIYGSSLYLALVLKNLNVVSSITTHQNIYSIPPLLNNFIAKLAISRITKPIFKNKAEAEFEFEFESELKAKSIKEIKKIDKDILSNLILNNGGGIDFNHAISSNEMLILTKIHEEDIANNIINNDIYNLFTKNKSTLKNNYDMFSVLTFCNSSHPLPKYLDDLIDKIYFDIKKDSLGNECLSFKRSGEVSFYFDKPQINLFTVCFPTCSENILIDMLSTMKTVEVHYFKGLYNRRYYSGRFFHAIEKSGVSIHSIIQSFNTHPFPTAVDIFHNNLLSTHSHIKNGLVELDIIKQKNILTTQVNKTDKSSVKQKSRKF